MLNFIPSQQEKHSIHTNKHILQVHVYTQTNKQTQAQYIPCTHKQIKTQKHILYIVVNILPTLTICLRDCSMTKPVSFREGNAIIKSFSC